jgi:hypothetical protein
MFTNWDWSPPMGADTSSETYSFPVRVSLVCGSRTTTPLHNIEII